MIRSLRSRHRVMIAALTVALIVLFIAVLVVRKPAPVTPNIPGALRKTPTGDGGGKR